MGETRPLMLGLVGDSASGKTTLVRGVVRLLGHNGVTPVCLDDYHRYSRADMLTQGLTGADPAANNLAMMAEHLAALRAGGTIRKPVYDHRTGTLRGPEAVAAMGLVVAYGLLTLTPPPLAGLFDLTVYLEPDEALRLAWRFERDVRERGYTPTEVLAQRAARERDAARFVHVQRPLADCVVRFHAGPDGSTANLAVELIVRSTEGRDPLAVLRNQLAVGTRPGLLFERQIVDDDGCSADRLRIDPAISAEDAGTLAALIWPAVPQLSPIPLATIGHVRRADQPAHSFPLALTQLLLVALLVSSREL